MAKQPDQEVTSVKLKSIAQILSEAGLSAAIIMAITEGCGRLPLFFVLLAEMLGSAEGCMPGAWYYSIITLLATGGIASGISLFSNREHIRTHLKNHARQQN